MNRLFDLLQSGGRRQGAPAIQSSNAPAAPEAVTPSTTSGPSSLYDLMKHQQTDVSFGSKRKTKDDFDIIGEEVGKSTKDSENAKKFSKDFNK